MARQSEASRTSDLAKALSVAAPSVTGMLTKMAGKGLIARTDSRRYRLTVEGQRQAGRLLRRHRLIETFLTRTLNYGWDEVHYEAHRLEHSVSERFIERLAKFLEYPERDPHGAPIPHTDGSIASDDSVLLLDWSAGVEAIVAQVGDEDDALLAYYGRLGIRPGARIRIVEKVPYEGGLVLEVNGQNCQIGLRAAGQVRVREV
ncbi:MAG: metal-dependent transcriptional regulator [Calditrichaeota bacterium]|nr:metal-dependent transcriptional regulator [Calditrichota bacterium]